MVSKFAFSNLLLASAALAASSSQQEARLARRQENHQSQPVNSHGVASSARDVSKVIDLNPYSAGAVVSQDNGTFTTVTGSFVVPSLSGSDSNTTSGFSIQVGIDSYYNCSSGFLVGINGMITDGVSSYSAWYGSKLLSDNAYDLPGITINANDVLTLSIISINIAFIENQTTGQKANMTFYYPWCGTDVEWAVGVHKGNNSIPLANFGIVTITNATAIDINNYWNSEDDDVTDHFYSPLNQTATLDIMKNQTIFTFTNTAEDSVLVQYLPGN